MWWRAARRRLTEILQLQLPIPLVQKGRLPPIPILAFGEKAPEGAQVTILTDLSVGGKSHAKLEVLPVSGDHQHSSGEGGEAAQVPMRAIFSGHVSTSRPAALAVVKRTGYCAFRVDFRWPIQVDDLYEGMRLRVRTDGRTYTTNIQAVSFIPDALYQGYIKLPADQWFTIQLPFRDMTLTRLGRISDYQRDLEGAFEIESIGFMIADDKDGPFRFEVEYVEAVDKVTGRPVDEVAEAPGSQQIRADSHQVLESPNSQQRHL